MTKKEEHNPIYQLIDNGISIFGEGLDIEEIGYLNFLIVGFTTDTST